MSSQNRTILSPSSPAGGVQIHYAIPALLTGLLLTLHLSPIWSVTYLPHQDAPAHLYNVYLLASHWSGEHNHLATNYHLNHWWMPTWLVHLCLLGLSNIAPYLVAEKLLASIYLVSLPLVLCFAIRSSGGAGWFGIVAGIPLAFNYPFNMGFQSFCFTLPLAIATIALWIKASEIPSTKALLSLSALTLLTYFTHVTGLIATVAAISSLQLLNLGTQLRRKELKSQIARCAIPVAALLPSLALLATFALTRQTITEFPSVPKRVLQLLSLTSIASYELRELVLTSGIALALTSYTLYLLLTRRSEDRRIRGPQWLIVTCSLLFIYLLWPETKIIDTSGIVGGGFTTNRMQLFPLLTLVVWLGLQKPNPRAALLATIPLLVFGILLSASRLNLYRKVDKQLKEYVEIGRAVPRGATVFPLHFRAGGKPSDELAIRGLDLPASAKALLRSLRSSRRSSAQLCDRGLSELSDPFRHASGYLAVVHRVFTVDNYEGTMGYFPLVYRQERNPYLVLGQTETIPPRPHLSHTSPIWDYVLVWQADSQCPVPEPLIAQLERLELVATSEPHGFARLYRARQSRRTAN